MNEGDKLANETTDHDLFVAEVKRCLSLRHWKYKDLAVAAGYSLKSIEAFMHGSRQSATLRLAIAAALNIDT